MEIDDLCRGRELVVDTNVLVHATTPGGADFSSSLVLVEWLRGVADVTILVLDDTGKTAPDESTSVLLREYREHLAPQTASATLVTYMMLNGRVRFAVRPNKDVRARLKAAIPHNPQDRAVAGAACDSAPPVLVSNDFRDFSRSARSLLRKTLDLRILCSAEAVS